jgi:hypothetical protein
MKIMIKPVVRKFKIEQVDEDKETVRYWLSKTPEERMNAMGELHKQQIIIEGYKEVPRIKKVVQKIKNIK